ncbi:MAG: hypothetical protein K8R35_02890 [Bacteroidales bacterium]|nr:hypothetical protein [Bacteroidales bacterium]
MKHVSRQSAWLVVKWIAILFIIIVIVRCSAIKPMSEGSLVITRKYAGNYLDFRQTGEGGPLDPYIFWIKTSLEEKYGKIGVYAKGQMAFTLNDRLYLRRTFYQHPAMKTWEYKLESGDQQIFYYIFGTNIDSTRKSALDRLFEIPKQD